MNWFAARRFLSYHWRAKGNLRLHSPKAFELHQVLQSRKGKFKNNWYRDYRKHWLQMEESMDFVDSYSKENGTEWVAKKISNQCLQSSLSRSYCNILGAVTKWRNPQGVLEVGTGFGFSSMAILQQLEPSAGLLSIDLNAALQQQLAEAVPPPFRDQLELTAGAFDERLPELVQAGRKFDLFYIDGHHEREATLAYFDLCLQMAAEDAVFVFDDINWSAGMRKAWERIEADERVRISIDLFRFGIAMNDPGVKGKQKLVLRV